MNELKWMFFFWTGNGSSPLEESLARKCTDHASVKIQMYTSAELPITVYESATDTLQQYQVVKSCFTDYDIYFSNGIPFPL
jgi:hypothetical protein